MLTGKTVVLGVTGSIAAYKSACLASLLVKAHAVVLVSKQCINNSFKKSKYDYN